jgi:hypothetical protein
MSQNITYSNLELAKRIHESACTVSKQEDLLNEKIDATKTEIIEVIKDIDNAVDVLHEKVTNLTELDVSIGSSFITNTEVGGIKAGTTINSDDEIKEILKKLLLKMMYAEIVTRPTCKLSISNSKSSYEIGTEFTPTLKLTYNDGKFKSYSDNGNTVSEVNAKCASISNRYEITQNSTTKAYEQSPIIVTENPITIKGFYSYSASAEIPTNSDGTITTENGYEKLIIEAGECESNACTINGKYGLFFTTLYTGVENVDRSTFNNTPLELFSTGTKKLLFDDKVIYLAIPKGYILEEAISETNEEQTPNSTTEIEIEDAGGTKRPYILYTFKYSATGGLGLYVNCNIKKA